MKTEFKNVVIFLGPLLILPALFVIWPLIELMVLSLKHKVILFEIDRWAGLENYQYLLGKDARFWGALGNTLYFTVCSVGLELVLGLMFALYLRFGKESAWIKVILLLPWAIPNVVSARLWQWMLHPEVGIINHVLLTLGWINEPVLWLSDPTLALNAAILADIWKTTPLITLLLFAGLQRIPETILSAAKVDRTPPVRFLFYILLPQLNPMLRTAMILRGLDAFRVFDVIYVMTGGGPANSTETLSIYAYRTYFQSLQFGYGSSIALTQVILMLAMTWIIMNAFSSKWDRS